MKDQQMQAMDRLRDLSQTTHYLIDWAPSLRSHLLKIKQTEPIPEVQQVPTKPPPLKKEVSHRYDLKQWERRKEMLSKIDYPMENENLFASEQLYQPPTFRVSQVRQAMKKEIKPEETGRNIYRVIQSEFVKAKLEFFRKKHIASQQKLKDLALSSKSRNPIKSLPLKKKKTYEQPLRQRSLANPEEIDAIRKQVKYERRLSMPHLLKHQAVIQSYHKMQNYL